MPGMRMELDGLDLEPDGYTIPADPTWTPPPAPRWRRALDLVCDKAGEALAWFGLRPEPGPKQVSAIIEAPVATTAEAAAELGAQWLQAWRDHREDGAALQYVLVDFAKVDGQGCRIAVTGPGQWREVPGAFARGGLVPRAARIPAAWPLIPPAELGEPANSGNGSAASGAGGDTPGSNPENRRTPMQDKDLPERLAEERVAPHGDDLGRAAHRIDTAEPIAPRRQAVRIIGDGDVRATRVLGESGEPLQRVTSVSFEHRVGEPPKARVETVLPSIDAVVLDAEVGPDPVTELRILVEDSEIAALSHGASKLQLQDQHGRPLQIGEWRAVPEEPLKHLLVIPVKNWQPDVDGLREALEEARVANGFVEEQCAKARTRAGWVERVLRAAGAAPTPGDRDRILMEGLKGLFKTDTGTSTLPCIREQPFADEKTVRTAALMVGTNEAVDRAAAEDSARIENVQLRADLERARAEAKASNDQAAQALSERDVADRRAQAAEQEVEKAHVHLAVLETQARILVGNLNGSDGMPQAWWLEAADAVRTIERLTTVSQAAATKGGAEAPRG